MGSAASCLQRIAAAGGERQRFFTSAELAANGRDPFAHGSKTAGGVMTGSSSMTPPSSPEGLNLTTYAITSQGRSSSSSRVSGDDQDNNLLGKFRLDGILPAP